MAIVNNIYCSPGDIIVPGVGADGDADYLPANSFQARAYADGQDIHDGILAVANDQATFTPPHPLRNCTSYQWYYDNLVGAGNIAIPGATSDTYTIREDAGPTGIRVEDSGEYWCEIRIGSVEEISGQHCIIRQTPRQRIICIDCLQPQEIFMPYEGGDAELKIRRPGFIAGVFEHPCRLDDIGNGFCTSANSAPEWIGSLEQSRLSTVIKAGDLIDLTTDLVETVFTLTIAPGEDDLARQAYATVNVGEFQCKYPVTQDYPIDGSATTPAMKPTPASSVGGNVEFYTGLGSNLSVNIGDNVVALAHLNVSPTTDNANPLGGCDGTEEFADPDDFNFSMKFYLDGVELSGEMLSRSCAFTIDVLGVDVDIETQPYITGSILVTAESTATTKTLEVRAFDSDGGLVSTDTRVIEWHAQGAQIGTEIEWLEGTAYLPSVSNATTILTPVAPRTTKGSFEITGSPAIARFVTTRGGWFGAFAGVTSSTPPSTFEYNIIGPTPVNNSITLSSDDGAESVTVEHELQAGQYSYTMEIGGVNTHVGNGTFTLTPTVYPPLNFNI